MQFQNIHIFMYFDTIILLYIKNNAAMHLTK